jgi:hypothetical protein
MKKQILKLLFISIILFSFLSNCERKISGWGEDGDIHVLADSTVWLATEPILRDVFEKPIMTPQDETIFTIFKAELDKFKRFKNLIFIATLDGEGAVTNVVNKSLEPEAKQKVTDGNFVFFQKEKWATEQYIMFLVSTDIANLKQKITENKDYLFDIFNNYWNEINKKRMFSVDEQIEVEKMLLEKYDWMVAVPDDYIIFKENPDSNFVMLRRYLPERWLFVHWIDTYDPSVINTRWCIDKRNEIGVNFYEGDQIEEKFVQPDTAIVNFLDRRALKISGLWRNDEKQAGGPFRNYCFYDEKSRRIYMLDYALFSPRLKKSKRNLLRQAEILLHTFKTSDEISEKGLGEG